MTDKTHYRKVFLSPYLSSADITEPTVLTIARVVQEIDKTKKTKDVFNTAYFVEKTIREGEKLKPLILNAINSKTVSSLVGSAFIEDWQNVRVTVYVDHNVKFGASTVEGLRINATPPPVKKTLTPEDAKMWANAISAYQRDGNLEAVLKRMSISDENQKLIIEQAKNVA